MTAGAQQ